MMFLLILVTQTGRMQPTQKKASINMKSQQFIVPAVNRFVEVPSSTDDIVGAVTKNLLEIQQKKLFSFNENYK